MAVINRTIKDALDDLTDNEELKNVLTYFGYLDLGKYLSGIFQYTKSQKAIQKGNCGTYQLEKIGTHFLALLTMKC